MRFLLVLSWVELLGTGPLMAAEEPAKVRYTVPDVPYIQQSHRNTCGAAALAMLLQYHGKKATEQDLIDAYPKMKRTGFYVPWLWEYSSKVGFRTTSGATTADAVKKLLRSNTPVIVYQFSTLGRRRPHFRVVVGYDDERKAFTIWDPTPQLGKGHKLSYENFGKLWRLRYFRARTHFHFAITGVLPPAPSKTDIVLYRHPEHYAAFPSLYRSPTDQLWVSFGWNTTRSHYGAAAGGRRGGVSLCSPDGGKTWHRAGQDKQYIPLPDTCRAFVLKGGSMLTIGPRMHEVLPLSKKDELEKQGIAVKAWPAGHISASYRVLLRRRAADGQKWATSHPKLPRFASMGGFGRGVVLADGTILKPVYGLAHKDDPATRTWVLRSTDSGASWQLVTVACDRVHSFNEAELLALPDGRVLAMIRAFNGRGSGPRYDRGFLWQTVSSDKGVTWSQPVRTPIWGYPPHLLLTREGEVLCTYGYRRRPYGIRACFSRDVGRTWDIANEVILRTDALPKGPGAGRGSVGDLGYPRTVQLCDGTFFTVYYITLGDGVTHIAATRWPRAYVGPRKLKRGAGGGRTRLKPGLTGDHA